jgi:hypothetical protein
MANRTPGDLEAGKFVEDIQLGQGTLPKSTVRVIDMSNLIPNEFDEIALTYVASGNGAGEIETATYKKNSTTIATLTLTYDSNNRLTNVART